MKISIAFIFLVLVGCGKSSGTAGSGPSAPDDGKAKALVNGTSIGFARGYYKIGSTPSGSVYTITLIPNEKTVCDFSKRIEQSIQITVAAKLGAFDESSARVAFFYDQPNHRTAYDVSDKVALNLISESGRQLIGSIDAKASTAQVKGAFVATLCP